MSNALQEKLVTAVTTMSRPGGGLLKAIRGDGLGVVLRDVYVWQTLRRTGEQNLKAAWRDAQGNGVVESDNTMRARGIGEHVICAGRSFSCVATVARERSAVDVDALVVLLSRKYGIPAADLVALAELCRVSGRPVLTKRVVEN